MTTIDFLALQTRLSGYKLIVLANRCGCDTDFARGVHDTFWRSLHGLTDPGDTRMTRQQRRRLKHMIRATDGRRNDASYKEIAEVIFGVKRVASEPWKTSPLRDATMDLVKDGFHMIEVGYRKLLRHRRRF